jgi:hypothetical protein
MSRWSAHRLKVCRKCGRKVNGYHDSVIPCPMTPDMMAALASWKEEKGRTWKAQLRDAWTRGRYLGNELQNVRNVVGPSGLDKIHVPSFGDPPVEEPEWSRP